MVLDWYRVSPYMSVICQQRGRKRRGKKAGVGRATYKRGIYREEEGQEEGRGRGRGREGTRHTNAEPGVRLKALYTIEKGGREGGEGEGEGGERDRKREGKGRGRGSVIQNQEFVSVLYQLVKHTHQ